jgi:hypothetical protein
MFEVKKPMNSLVIKKPKSHRSMKGTIIIIIIINKRKESNIYE